MKLLRLWSSVVSGLLLKSSHYLGRTLALRSLAYLLKTRPRSEVSLLRILKSWEESLMPKSLRKRKKKKPQSLRKVKMLRQKRPLPLRKAKILRQNWRSNVIKVTRCACSGKEETMRWMIVSGVLTLSVTVAANALILAVEMQQCFNVLGLIVIMISAETAV